MRSKTTPQPSCNPSLPQIFSLSPSMPASPSHLSQIPAWAGHGGSQMFPAGSRLCFPRRVSLSLRADSRSWKKESWEQQWERGGWQRPHARGTPLPLFPVPAGIPARPVRETQWERRGAWFPAPSARSTWVLVEEGGSSVDGKGLGIAAFNTKSKS